MTFEKVPAELRALRQWVDYMLIDDPGKDKPRKVPINPWTLRGASSGKPDTWGTFEQAVSQIGKMGTVTDQDGKPVSAPIVGIGFEFAENGGYVGVDFDHCIDQNGALSAWAIDKMERLYSYTEVSPSGSGIHILCKGKLPGKAVKRPHAEMYDCGRYFTVTGDTWGVEATPLRDPGEALKQLYAELQADGKKIPQSTGAGAAPAPGGSASDGIEAARHSKNAAKFEALFMGEWQGAYSSQSQADQAFCNLLAFYCRKDPAAMDDIFRRSGLMRPKWDQRHGAKTYGEMTIEKAIADTTEVWEPKTLPADVYGRAEYTEPDRGKPAPEKLGTVSAPELQRMDLPPVQFVINGLLPVGLGLLVSPPKYGKSWMVLDMGLSIAGGRPFLGHEAKAGGCLYLALEDSLNRLKDRMQKVLQGAPAPEGFDYAVKCLDLSHGLLEQLEGYLKEKPGTRLIIIDTLQKVRGQSGGKENAYTADYREMGLLKAFADQHGICILLVHHLRKMGDDGDPFNRISGTAAIFGAADVAMVLSREKRQDSQTTFSFEGRDIESGSIVLEFDKEVFRWKLLGDADWLAEERARLRYRNDPIVQTVKTLLEQHPEGWSGTSSDLLDAGKVLLTAYIAGSPRELTGKLTSLDKPLFEYDGIVHTKGKNGSGGGKHRFYYRSTEKYEQTVISPI